MKRETKEGEASSREYDLEQEWDAMMRRLEELEESRRARMGQYSPMQQQQQPREIDGEEIREQEEGRRAPIGQNLPMQLQQQARQRASAWTMHNAVDHFKASSVPKAPVSSQVQRVPLLQRQQTQQQLVGVYQPASNCPRMLPASAPRLAQRPYMRGDGGGPLNTIFTNTPDYYQSIERSREHRRRREPEPSEFVQMCRTPEKNDTEATDEFGGTGHVSRSLQHSRRLLQRHREDSDSWSRSPVATRRLEDDMSSAFQSHVKSPQLSSPSTHPVSPRPMRASQPPARPVQLPRRPPSQSSEAPNIWSPALRTLTSPQQIKPRSRPTQRPILPMPPSTLHDFKPSIGSSHLPYRPPSAQSSTASKPRAESSELVSLLTAPRKPLPQHRQVPVRQEAELLLKLKSPRPRSQKPTSADFVPLLIRRVKRSTSAETEERDTREVPAKMARMSDATDEQRQFEMIKSAFDQTRAALKNLEELVLNLHAPKGAEYDLRREVHRQQHPESVRRRELRKLPGHLAVSFGREGYKEETGASKKGDKKKWPHDAYESDEGGDADGDDEEHRQH